MAEGTVKWFNPRRGYGFISQADGERSLRSLLRDQMDGYKTLDEGQRVSFEVTTGQNGKLQASDVHKLLKRKASSARSNRTTNRRRPRPCDDEVHLLNACSV